MSVQYGSMREALAFAFSCRRGPQLAQSRWMSSSRSTGRTPWDAPIIRALLYGDASSGMCGVEPGSDLDDELEEWAMSRDTPMSDRVADVLAQLSRLMREQGMHARSLAPRRDEYRRWTDPEGRSWLTLRRA